MNKKWNEIIKMQHWYWPTISLWREQDWIYKWELYRWVNLTRSKTIWWRYIWAVCLLYCCTFQYKHHTSWRKLKHEHAVLHCCQVRWCETRGGGGGGEGGGGGGGGSTGEKRYWCQNLMCPLSLCSTAVCTQPYTRIEVHFLQASKF